MEACWWVGVFICMITGIVRRESLTCFTQRFVCFSGTLKYEVNVIWTLHTDAGPFSIQSVKRIHQINLCPSESIDEKSVIFYEKFTKRITDFIFLTSFFQVAICCCLTQTRQQRHHNRKENEVKLDPFSGFLHHIKWDGAQARGNWLQLTGVIMIWNEKFKFSRLTPGISKKTVHWDASLVLNCIKNLKGCC